MYNITLKFDFKGPDDNEESLDLLATFETL